MPDMPSETLAKKQQLRDIEENRDVAAIAYLWILSVVVLYRYKHSPFVQLHARQGMWLFMVSIPIWLVPRVGHYLEFFVLAAMIIGFLNAAQGQYHDLPIIGALARGTLTLRDLWRVCLDGIVHSVHVMKKGVMGPERKIPPQGQENGVPVKTGEQHVRTMPQSERPAS